MTYNWDITIGSPVLSTDNDFFRYRFRELPSGGWSQLITTYSNTINLNGLSSNGCEIEITYINSDGFSSEPIIMLTNDCVNGGELFSVEIGDGSNIIFDCEPEHFAGITLDISIPNNEVDLIERLISIDDGVSWDVDESWTEVQPDYEIPLSFGAKYRYRVTSTSNVIIESNIVEVVCPFLYLGDLVWDDTGTFELRTGGGPHNYTLRRPDFSDLDGFEGPPKEIQWQYVNSWTHQPQLDNGPDQYTNWVTFNNSLSTTINNSPSHVGGNYYRVVAKDQNNQIFITNNWLRYSRIN